MTFVDYGTDRIFYPIIIDSTNNQIVFQEDSTVYTFTIDEGVYWAHRANATDYPSLYLEIEGKLNAQSVTGNYEFFAYTLPGDDFEYSSLELRDTSASGVSFSWNFGDPNFTFPPGPLGFNRDRDNIASSTKNSDSLFSLKSILGQWISPKQAAYKTRQNRERQIFRSDAGPNAVVHSWTPTAETRVSKYFKIHAAHVYRYRALDATAADEAGLTDNDTNNAFEDVVEAWQIGEVCFTVFDKGENANILDPTNSTFQRDASLTEPNLVEAWKVHPSNPQLDDITSDKTRWEGEHYDLEWPHMIYEDDTQFAGYDH